MQGYLIYQIDNEIIARGRIDGTELARSTDATTVFQTVLDTLEQHGGGEVFIESGRYHINQPVRIPGRVTVRGIR